MTLDLPTLLLAGILVAALTASASCLAWLGDRGTKTLLWMSLASVLAVIGTVCRVVLPEQPAVLFGNIAMVCALASIPAACRALDRLPPRRWPFVVPTLTWAIACSFAAFRADINTRIALASALCCLPVGSAMWELWKRRADRLTSRWVALAVLTSGILFYAARLCGAVVQIGSTQPPPGAVKNFGLLALLSIGFAVLINFAMMMLAKERAAQHYRAEAETDALTGLLNRRRLATTLQVKITRARRTGEPLAVVMIDVDRFKAFNDLYGHPAGDACLNQVAGALRVCLRGATVFRYGGEEFAVILARTDWPGAELAAERLRSAIRALALPHTRSETGRVSISLGYAVMAPATGDTPVGLLQAADRALYRAKAMGRDRTCSARAEPKAA